MVEQCDRLFTELAHRVAPHVVRPVRLAMPQTVKCDDVMAALRQGHRQLPLHRLREELAVKQHAPAGTLAVDAVGQALVLELEEGHDRRQAY